MNNEESRKPVSLERVIPLYIAIGIAVISLFQITAASFIISGKFNLLEISDMEGRREQFRILIERERKALESIVQSYAEWTMSYNYVFERNGDYITDSYSPAWFVSQQMDLVIIMDADGDFLWSNIDIPRLERETGQAFLKPRNSLLFPPNFGSLPPSPVSGIMKYGDANALYAAWPITDDIASVPPVGMLVFARFLTPALMKELAPAEDFGVSFLPLSDISSDLPNEIRIQKSAGGTEYLAYDPVKDVSGSLIGYWRYEKRIKWSSIAWNLREWFTVLALISGIGAYLVGIILVKRRLVTPIKGIRDYLYRFAESFETGERLEPLHNDELGELMTHVNVLTEQVERQTRDLDRMARTDGLTGLPNRRCLDMTLIRLQQKASAGRSRDEERSASKKGSIACGIIDVDFFKKYNDAYGHAEGDEVLRRIAQAISEGVRQPDDLPSRYGGEEFAVVLPDTDEAGAEALLERIRVRIEGFGIAHETSDAAPVVTISAGAAASTADSDLDMEALFKLADKALYAAKAAGRNRVVRASSVWKEITTEIESGSAG